jgi:hypothetical protein
MDYFDPQIAPIPADSKYAMAFVLDALHPFLSFEIPVICGYGIS